jgi:hypothetical protein
MSECLLWVGIRPPPGGAFTVQETDRRLEFKGGIK